MELLDPSGESWRVRRRWLSWRIRPREPDAMDPLSGVGGDDLFAGLLFALVVTVLVLLAPWLLVGVVLVVEAGALLLSTPAVVVARAVRLGGWPIEVERRSDRVWVRVHAERRRGWLASRRRMDELRGEIRSGTYPAPRHLT